jgi:hypothetical protein
MTKFNTLFRKILESNTTSMFTSNATDTKVYGGAADTRPIEPAKIVLGAKKCKKCKIPIQRRPKIENIILKAK